MVMMTQQDIHLTFDHVGIACRDIDKTKGFYLAMGYQATPVVEDPIQQVRISFLHKEGSPSLELLEPLNENSPVDRTLRSVGVSPYHICYRVDDIETAITQLRSRRFLLVSGPVHACAMGDRQIAFLFEKNTGLIELVETER